MIPTRLAESAAVFVAPPEAVSVLRAVLAELPMGFPGAIAILLHEGDGHERPVAANLNVSSALMVAPGAVGTVLCAEHAYVIRPSQNLVVGKDGRLEPASSSSDTLLHSLAAHYGRRGVAIALTALEGKEAEGFRLVREAGGYTIALDEADRLWTKPAGPRVVPNGADELLPAKAIGKRLLAMLLPVPLAA